MTTKNPKKTLRNTSLRVALVCALWAFAAAAIAEPVRVVHHTRDGNTTITIAAKDGKIGWDTLADALTRTAGLDGDPIAESLRGRSLDLTCALNRAALRALSAAVPDLELRVVRGGRNAEPVLRVRFECAETRQKVRRSKSWLRRAVGDDTTRYGLKLPTVLDRTPASTPLVVLTHGYSGGSKTLEPLREALVTRGYCCALFTYPNDGPLETSGQLLARELADFRKSYPDRRLVIVAHSMGGLVARWALENPDLDPGNVSALIMIGTPNHGSRWAQLPGGLECCEQVPRMGNESITDLFVASIQDGLNEARTDLKPGSMFLQTLNGRPRNASVKYTILLGTAAPLTATEFQHLRNQICKMLGRRRTGRVVLPRVQQLLDDFEEVQKGKGDGVVSLRRGRLRGVDDVRPAQFSHWALAAGPRSQQFRELVEEVCECLERGK